MKKHILNCLIVIMVIVYVFSNFSSFALNSNEANSDGEMNPVVIEPRGIVGELDAYSEDTPLGPGIYNVLFYSYSNQEKACVVFKYVKAGIAHLYSVICAEGDNHPYYAWETEALALPLVHQGSLSKNNLYNCNHYEDPVAFFFNGLPANLDVSVDVFVKYTYRVICFKPENESIGHCINRDSDDFETIENVASNPDFFLDKQAIIKGSYSTQNLGCMHIDDTPLYFLTQGTLDQIRAQDPPDPYAQGQNYSYEIFVGRKVDLKRSEPHLRWLARFIARLLGRNGKKVKNIANGTSGAKKGVAEAATGEAAKASQKMVRNPAFPDDISDWAVITNFDVKTMEEAERLGLTAFWDKQGRRWQRTRNGQFEPVELPSDADIFQAPTHHGPSLDNPDFIPDTPDIPPGSDL